MPSIDILVSVSFPALGTKPDTNLKKESFNLSHLFREFCSQWVGSKEHHDGRIKWSKAAWFMEDGKQRKATVPEKWWGTIFRFQGRSLMANLCNQVCVFLIQGSWHTRINGHRDHLMSIDGLLLHTSPKPVFEQVDKLHCRLICNSIIVCEIGHYFIPLRFPSLYVRACTTFFSRVCDCFTNLISRISLCIK